MAERTSKAREIAQREAAMLAERTPESARWYQRAIRSMAQGVASSFQAKDPYPLYVAEGRGSRIRDVDGNTYVDFHNAFGTMVVGHAHPKVAEAIEHAARTGTQFAATTPTTVAFAEELCRRFSLDSVRFTNSGTEATMDAIRLARAATGRDVVAKIEGSYHGHHDTVMFLVAPEPEVLRGTRRRASSPIPRGVPSEMARRTVVVPFNDAAALERLLSERGDEVACLIMEPVMMNIGIVLPEEGYLQAVRDLCTRFDVVLIFDEVKSGAAIAKGGAVELFGVRPDLVCLAKAIGGGVPCGAFGGRASLMEEIGRGAAQHGTFNGNPLVAAAGLAALTEVLIPEAYEHLGKFGARLAEGCRAAITAHDVPAHALNLGSKGCVSYRRAPLRNYRDFLDTDPELFAAVWPWMVNRGVFLSPGDEEQWTISVQHDAVDIDGYVEAFEGFCQALTS